MVCRLNVVKCCYDKNLVDIFDEAVSLNNKTLAKAERLKNELKNLLSYFNGDKPAYIYGAGARGRALLAFLHDRGLEATGFVISDGQGKERFAHLGIPVYYLSELPKEESGMYLVLALADESVQRNLQIQGIEFQVAPNYLFPFIKQYVQLLC